MRLEWDAIPPELFGSSEQMEDFHSSAVAEGLFRDLAVNQSSGEKVDNFLLEAMLNHSVQSLSNYRAVLQRWVTAFRTANVSPEMSAGDTRDNDRMGGQGANRRLG